MVGKRSADWVIEEPSRNVHSFKMYGMKSGWEQHFLLVSDIHWDNPHCRWSLLKRDFEQAKERNAPILIFGDFFCAMQGRWDKRSSKDDVRTEHQSGNYLDALVETATDWLEPYKDQLAIISDGNHETSILKHHETDLLERLCSRLRDRGSIVRHGGYSGWVRLMFQHEAGGRRDSKRIYYTHGFAAGGPVSKGAIDFNRLREYVDADIYCAGHVHWKGLTPVKVATLTEKNVVRTVSRYYVRCATYKDEYADGHSGWHIEKGRGPRPLGGWWLRVFYSEGRVKMEFVETET